EARDWLVEYLTAEGGQDFAREVKKAARDAGIAERTLTRARQRAGVTTSRVGFGGAFVWSLPDSEQHDLHSGHSGHVSESGLDGRERGPDGPGASEQDLGARVSQSDLDDLAAHERARERAPEGLDDDGFA